MQNAVRTFIAVAALTLPVAATAQSPQMCGWYYLDGRDTPTTLAKLRARAAQAPAWLPEAEAQLLSWYRACDHGAARTAVLELERYRKRTNSRDPLLLAWRAVALVRGPNVQLPRTEGALLRAVYLDSNSERDGARILVDVLKRTGWPELAEELAAVAVMTRDPYTLGLAHDALWEAAATYPDSVLWSALAEVELARHDYEAVQRSAAHTPTSPRALRAAGLAQMMSQSDAQAGAHSYLRGLAHALSATDLQPYFDDLRLLLAEDEVVQWSSLRTGHAEWIRRKWEWRAHMSGVHVADRLQVNARRLDHAVQRYIRGSHRGAPPVTSIWFDSAAIWRQPVDDRGLIYVRHGEPAAELKLGGSMIFRMAWVYEGLAPSATVFEFDKAPDRADYFLAEPNPICGGRHVLTQARRNAAYPDTGDLRDWAAVLMQYDPSLAQYYFRCGNGSDVAMFSYIPERAGARSAAQTAIRSESGVAVFTKPLTTSMNVYAFPAPSGSELVTYLSVEAPDTTRSQSWRVLLSVGDPVTETTIQLDTTIAYAAAAPIARGTVIHTALPLRVQPQERARITMSVRSTSDAARGRISATTRRVAAYQGNLLLSDLVIAAPRAGTLRRGEHQLAAIPGHVVASGTPFRLFYELYGARTDDDLAISILITPGRDDAILQRLRSLLQSRNALSLSFEEQAQVNAAGIMGVERDITADLQPGRYDVVVTVRNVRTGQEASTHTSMVVLEQGR